MKILGFEWDEGNWPKCAKHGVSKAEIEFVLTSAPMVMPDRSPVTQETRFNAIGLTKEGRHLFVVFIIRETNSDKRLRVISARYMHKKEITRYEQR
ncbi:MAG: BrnT family toxin [Hoeflea sp.]|uniref:BrnT family toxin n=1 Tax=Hoeflea sp. TaxID=1940281 RepID=UPI003EF46712